MYIHIYIYIYQCIYVYTCMYIYIHMYIYTYVCMYVCIYIHTVSKVYPTGGPSHSQVVDCAAVGIRPTDMALHGNDVYISVAWRGVRTGGSGISGISGETRRLSLGNKQEVLPSGNLT